jgi:hypothetical protein
MNKNNKKLESTFTLTDTDGFKNLSIRIYSCDGRYYYGFDYETEKGELSNHSPTVGDSIFFTTEAAAFFRAIRNIENHFVGNFRLKSAYAKYNELTQLTIA